MITDVFPLSNRILSSLMIYYRIFNTMGATSVAGTDYAFEAPEFALVFSEIRVVCVVDYCMASHISSML